MIDLLSTEQVRDIIKQRKQEFKFDGYFLVLTPLNHVFRFWNDGDVGIFDSFNNYRVSSYQPKVAKLYGVEYDSNDPYFRHPTTRKHLYNLFISDPICMFFQYWDELRQELQTRELI